MALINQAKKEVNAKLVLFGAPRAGKGTALHQLYKRMRPESRGKVKAMATQGDRLLFFDFQPTDPASFAGYTVRVHLYTAPGAVAGPATWKMALKGLDGLLFMADSQPASLPAASEHFRQLEELLGAQERSLADIPVLVLANKADLAGVASAADVAAALGVATDRVRQVSAATGAGLLEGLAALVSAVLQQVRAELGIEATGEVALANIPPAAPVVTPAEASAPAVAPPVTVGNGGVNATPALQVEFGTPQAAAGTLRLPLVCRLGDQEQRLTLTIGIKAE